MKTDTSAKKTRQGLSLSPELLASAKEKAGDNLSAYIRRLIEHDLAGTAAIPPPSDPRFLEKLYAAVLPSRVSRFQRLWDVHVKLAEETEAQSEVVEQMLRDYLAKLEAAPTTKIVDALDAAPGLVENLRATANREPGAAAELTAKIVRYTQPEEPSRHVAEGAPQPRTPRTLPHKPPKPKSTGTTP